MFRFLQKNSPHDVQTKGGEGSKAFWTMFKKTALFLKDGFPNKVIPVYLALLSEVVAICQTDVLQHGQFIWDTSTLKIIRPQKGLIAIKLWLPRSATYSSTFRTCKLSEEDRRTAPASFRPAQRGTDYLENECADCKWTWWWWWWRWLGGWLLDYLLLFSVC